MTLRRSLIFGGLVSLVASRVTSRPVAPSKLLICFECYGGPNVGDCRTVIMDRASWSAMPDALRPPASLSSDRRFVRLTVPESRFSDLFASPS